MCGMESDWDGTDDVAKKKVYPRAIMDLMGVSGKDKDKLGVKMLKSKKLEDLDEEVQKVLLRVLQTMIIRMGNIFSTVRREGDGHDSFESNRICTN